MSSGTTRSADNPSAGRSTTMTTRQESIYELGAEVARFLRNESIYESANEVARFLRNEVRAEDHLLEIDAQRAERVRVFLASIEALDDQGAAHGGSD
jgi:hypothetical protein